MHIAHKNMVEIIIMPCMSSENCFSENYNQRTIVVLSYSQLFQAVKGLVNPHLISSVYYVYVSFQDDSNGLRMH